MLKEHSLNEITEILGISPSTFSKEMTKDDYVYIKRENKYFKFVRDKSSNLNLNRGSTNYDFSEELLFIRDKKDIIKNLVGRYEDNSQFLILDKQIYENSISLVNKNFKVNVAIYKKFTSHCEENFPHFKLQDLLAQSLLDFVRNYKQ